MTAAAQFVERYSANFPMGHMGQDSKEGVSLQQPPPMPPDTISPSTVGSAC